MSQLDASAVPGHRLLIQSLVQALVLALLFLLHIVPAPVMVPVPVLGRVSYTLPALVRVPLCTCDSNCVCNCTCSIRAPIGGFQREKRERKRKREREREISHLVQAPTLQSQNALLLSHPNSFLYRSLGSVLELEGYLSFLLYVYVNVTVADTTWRASPAVFATMPMCRSVSSSSMSSRCDARIQIGFRRSGHYSRYIDDFRRR
jgi:hypothetical protein